MSGTDTTAGSDCGRSSRGSARWLRGRARILVIVARAFVKHLLQIVPDGLRAMDGLEQFRPQTLRFVPPPTACPSAALVKVKCQQPEEDDGEPDSNA